ncbi:MAG: thymidine kinase [Coxiellaceae bacterium]|nr:thymidine kinase [Coxiellaceae bacterium]
MAKLHFYYSAMNAGKSTTLLQSSHNYRERGMDTLLLCPEIDDRHGVGKITTRIGLQVNATIFNKDVNLFEHVQLSLQKNPNIHCILVDEAHFLSKQHVAQLCQVVDKLDIPVLAYGLRSDFQGEPFEGSLYLLVWADQLLEIKTICHCGAKATMNMRIDEKGNAIREGEQTLIGGNDSYISTCRKHFHLGQGMRQSVIMDKQKQYIE